MDNVLKINTKFQSKVFNIFAKEFNTCDYGKRYNSQEISQLDKNEIYSQMLRYFDGSITLPQSEIKKNFDIEFSSLYEFIKDAEKQHLNLLIDFFVPLIPSVLAKRIKIKIHQITIQKEHSPLIYRMH